MSFITCAYCRGQIDLDKEEIVEVPTGKAHKTCYDKRQQAVQSVKAEKTSQGERKSRKKDLKICYYCGKSFDITKEEFRMAVTNRYAHVECYNKNHSSDDEFISKIYKFLKEEVLITYDFAQCERQRKNFITKFGYTNEGILNALKYFYKVKKQSPEKSGNRIGIVPYVYNEAKEYYSTLEKKQKQLTKVVDVQQKKKNKVINISMPERPVDKGFIDLEAIGEGVD